MLTAPSNSSIGPGWRRALTNAGIGGLVTAILLGITGCAPGTPDGDSWRVDAQRAVADAAAAVETAALGLRENREGRVFDRYLQVVLVDAEEAVGTAGDTIGSKQPPAAEKERYEDVTGQVDEAASLVSTARIAVVDRDSARYLQLAGQLDSAADALSELEQDLQHPPRASR